VFPRISLFTLYVLVLNRGRVNVPGAVADFLGWSWRNRARRQPIDRRTRAYPRLRRPAPEVRRGLTTGAPRSSWARY
jgi:hypothetical protein